MKRRITVKMFLMVLVVLVSACESEFRNYYKIDENSGLTVYEYLEETGEYSTFLNALEIAGYKEILGSSGLFTILAVKDDAFSEYLLGEGFSSISELPEDDIISLISHHIIDWPYSAYDLTHGYYDEENPEDPQMFRKRTRSAYPVTVETSQSGKSYPVVHENKMMSVFSGEMLIASDALVSDLALFYPGKDLSSLQDTGIFAENAMIIESDIGVLNGWIHVVDEVIPPPPNQKEFLESSDKYSLFYDMAFSQARYVADDRYRELNSQLGYDTVFLVDLFNFDTEYIGKADNHLEQLSSQKEVQRKVQSTFIPDNTAFLAFLDDQFPLYENLPSDLPDIVKQKIVESGLFQELILPNKLFSGMVSNEYGLEFVYDEADISEYFYASNGPLYGVSSFRTPDEFNTILRPVLTDPNFSTFLAALDFSGLYPVLVSDPDDLNFTLLAFDNSSFIRSGFIYDPDISTFYKYGVILKKEEMKSIMSSHILRNIHSFEGEDEYFTEALDGNYIGYRDGIVWGGENFVFPKITEVFEEGNGRVYAIDGVITPTESSMYDELSRGSEYSEFFGLLEEAGLIQGESISLLKRGRYTCFVPSNNLIQTARVDELLPTDPDELADMLRYYFLELETYDDGMITGDIETLLLDEDLSTGFAKVYKTINLSGDPQNMILTSYDGTTANYVTSNIMTLSGSVHIIDNFLTDLN
jgi:uncharacterized surface protein with fasciclin (FAS1) repeats